MQNLFVGNSYVEANEIVGLFLITGNNQLLDSFTSQEVSHMQDVRNLIFVAIALFCGFSSIFLHLKKFDKKILLKILLWFDVIVLLCLTFFNVFFTLFHKVLFPQGNYLFSYDSLLIQTYPESFFVWMFVFVVGIINLITSIIYLKKNAQKFKKVHGKKK